MADKNYENEIIVESPFPGEVVQPVLSSPSTTGDNHTPTTTSVKPFPTKRTAVELLSQALNTRSKKILQEFEFAPSGSIKIGDFKEGLTGDLRLTPNGITARDIAGLTTFAIDGDDGSAVFKGTLRAGTIIGGGGKVFIEEVNGEGRIIVNDGANDRILIGFQLGGF